MKVTKVSRTMVVGSLLLTLGAPRACAAERKLIGSHVQMATTATPQSANVPPTKANTEYHFRVNGSWTVDANKMTRWADHQGYTDTEAATLFGETSNSMRIFPGYRLGALLVNITDDNESWSPLYDTLLVNSTMPGAQMRFMINEHKNKHGDNAGGLTIDIYEFENETPVVNVPRPHRVIVNAANERWTKAARLFPNHHYRISAVANWTLSDINNGNYRYVGPIGDDQHQNLVGSPMPNMPGGMLVGCFGDTSNKNNYFDLGYGNAHQDFTPPSEVELSLIFNDSKTEEKKFTDNAGFALVEIVDLGETSSASSVKKK